MARSNLASIIARVRLMIDDPSGAGQEFTDDEIQSALDLRRDEARYIPLTERETITPSPGGGATTEYLTFDAPVGDWEGGAALVDGDYDALTPATTDLVSGRWTFTTEPDLPVMVVGFTHDLYGASGDLLLQRATREALSFDVSADGTTLSRSQKADRYKQMAYDYLAKARTRSSHLVRSDERGDALPPRFH